MRGRFEDQGGLFSYIAPEARVPKDHPLRKVRELVRDVLGELSRCLGRLYASEGRPSIPPEQLLSALLLQVFYGIRSERQLMAPQISVFDARGERPTDFVPFEKPVEIGAERRPELARHTGPQPGLLMQIEKQAAFELVFNHVGARWIEQYLDLEP